MSLFLFTILPDYLLRQMNFSVWFAMPLCMLRTIFHFIFLLSVQVKQDDGLPSKICIKCAGVIGDYRPFVDKTLAAESERNSKCDSTSGSSTSCYFCLTSGTILFPVPEASINKSKDCFGIDVSVSRFLQADSC